MCIVIVKAIALIPPDKPLLSMFEGGEVDRRVGKLTDEAPEQATVESTHPSRSPHSSRCLRNKLGALSAALHKLTLHAESESVDWIGRKSCHES